MAKKKKKTYRHLSQRVWLKKILQLKAIDFFKNTPKLEYSLERCKCSI